METKAKKKKEVKEEKSSLLKRCNIGDSATIKRLMDDAVIKVRAGRRYLRTSIARVVSQLDRLSLPMLCLAHRSFSTTRMRV